MNYQYHIYSLPTGHPILTPKGAAISEEEFQESFAVVLDWLKQVDPDHEANIHPERRITGSILKKMFQILSREKKESFLDKKVLSFLYFVSYLIQIQNRERINPFLSHVMGQALFAWLPIPELVEHYLSFSAEKGSCLKDAGLLADLFCPETPLKRKGFKKDAEKALKYAKLAFHNPFNKHQINYVDYLYAKALYATGKEHAEECMEIIQRNLHQSEGNEKYIFSYLSLGLEITNSVDGLSSPIDIGFAEGLLAKEKMNFAFPKDECRYWLAQCCISGKNNEKDIDRAIELLTNIRNPRLILSAAISLAEIYLEGKEVPLDAEEARAIAELALLQDYGDPAEERAEERWWLHSIIAQAADLLSGKEESPLDGKLRSYGRYGECFASSKTENGDYLVSCNELGWTDKRFSEEVWKETERKYVTIGVPEFDRSDEKILKSRAMNLGRRLSRDFRLLSESDDAFGRFWGGAEIYRVMKNIEVLKLNDEQYRGWFIERGYQESEESFVSFFLVIRKAFKEFFES